MNTRQFKIDFYFKPGIFLIILNCIEYDYLWNYKYDQKRLKPKLSFSSHQFIPSDTGMKNDLLALVRLILLAITRVSLEIVYSENVDQGKNLSAFHFQYMNATFLRYFQHYFSPLIYFYLTAINLNNWIIQLNVKQFLSSTVHKS
jgi:hypothetical protein